VATSHFNSINFTLHQHRRSQGGPKGPCPLQIFRQYSHFVSWDACFQTKYCYSSKIKHFSPHKFFAPQIFGLATPLYTSGIQRGRNLPPGGDFMPQGGILWFTRFGGRFQFPGGRFLQVRIYKICEMISKIKLDLPLWNQFIWCAFDSMFFKKVIKHTIQDWWCNNQTSIVLCNALLH